MAIISLFSASETAILLSLCYWLILAHPNGWTHPCDKDSTSMATSINGGSLCCQMVSRMLRFPMSIHYNDVIMDTMGVQITSLTVVYSNVYSGTDQRKHQSSASLAFVRGIHRWPVNSLHKGLVTWKMFPFDDVLMLKNQTRNPNTYRAFKCVILCIYP